MMRPPRSPAGHRRRRFGLSTVLVLAVILAGLAGPAAAADDAPGERDRGVSTPSLRNGHLPGEALRSVAGVRLAPDAAEAFARMLEQARGEGVTLAVTDGYRSYELQVDVKRRKGALAATPGTSKHGWGIAVDFDMRVTDFAWLRANAARYGWVHPAWARPGGSKPEPWHWEYVGVPRHELVPTPVAPLAIGELVATVRLEPRERRPGAWFDVHEGLEGLEDGARHYAGTARPGDRGNFAVAGYHRRPGAALRGVDRLQPGDLVRVRTPADVEALYVVLDSAALTAADGWALGPDPLLDGSPRMMTLTTGSADGRLLVVWARRTS
jgi:hypothetical protein